MPKAIVEWIFGVLNVIVVNNSGLCSFDEFREQLHAGFIFL